MLKLVNIRKEFGGQRVLNGIHLEIRSAEFFALLGPSGCGKTTLLRVLAGLDDADGGEIYLDDRPIHQLPPQRRPFNMVFQKYALFPHLTVEENVAFGLRLRGVPASELAEKTRAALDLVGLSAWSSRRPETLSGGQAQRVAVARALVNQPRVLLLDEPLSALDQGLREHLRDELRELQRRLELCFISVTHDQDEAFAMSDRVGVMRNGRLEQVGAPREIYREPASAFVAGFLGRSVQWAGAVQTSAVNHLDVRLESGTLLRATSFEAIPVAAPVRLFARLENLEISAKSFGHNENVLQGKVIERIFRGASDGVVIELAGGTRMTLERPSEDRSLQSGQEVHVRVPVDKVWAFAGVGN